MIMHDIDQIDAENLFKIIKNKITISEVTTLNTSKKSQQAIIKGKLFLQ